MLVTFYFTGGYKTVEITNVDLYQSIKKVAETGNWYSTVSNLISEDRSTSYYINWNKVNYVEFNE